MPVNIRFDVAYDDRANMPINSALVSWWNTSKAQRAKTYRKEQSESGIRRFTFLNTRAHI